MDGWILENVGKEKSEGSGSRVGACDTETKLVSGCKDDLRPLT